MESVNFLICRSWDNGYILAQNAAVKWIWQTKVLNRLITYTLIAKGCLDIWELGQIEVIMRGQTLFMSRGNVFLLGYFVQYLGTDSLQSKIQAGKHCREEETDAVKI